MKLRCILLCCSMGWSACASSTLLADEALRAVIPMATKTPIIDGHLTEYGDALCTPLEYFHTDEKNRPAQIYYLWDETAFYVGVRTLDEKQFAPQELFWTGDAVEWYFDTRAGAVADRRQWNPGAVHCFFAALEGNMIKPRFTLRPGYEHAIPGTGVKVAAQATAYGLEYEFKLPWLNFPQFHPTVGARLHLDTELSYSDGVSRSFRSFVFGSPLSVEQPANLALVQLVERFTGDHWSNCGPILMPIRVDTPWHQETAPQVKASIAMPPNHMNSIGKIEFQLMSTHGEPIGVFPASEEKVIQPAGGFVVRMAHWPNTIAAPGAYHVQAVIYDKQGVELTRIAPRLVSVNMDSGY